MQSLAAISIWPDASLRFKAGQRDLEKPKHVLHLCRNNSHNQTAAYGERAPNYHHARKKL